MRRERRIGAVGVLVASIALLLPAGVMGVTAMDHREPEAEAERRAGVAAFAQEGITEDQPAGRPTEQTVVATTVAPPPTVVRPPVATLPAPTTTTRRSTATTVAASTRPTLVTPTTHFQPPPQPPPVISTTGRWSATNDGLSVRMRMEPVAPVAGQPVTFSIDDLIAPDACCFVKIMFGDMTEANPVADPTCASPSTRTGMVATHTYAAPGIYRVSLFTATVPCTSPPPNIRGVTIQACIWVGPGAATAAACPPLSGEIG